MKGTLRRRRFSNLGAFPLGQARLLEIGRGYGAMLYPEQWRFLARQHGKTDAQEEEILKAASERRITVLTHDLVELRARQESRRKLKETWARIKNYTGEE